MEEITEKKNKTLPLISFLFLIASLFLIFTIIDTSLALGALAVVGFFASIIIGWGKQIGKEIVKDFIQRWNDFSNLIHLGIIVIGSTLFIFALVFFIRNYDVECRIKSKALE